ncbi:MAG: hypothetical protein JSV36_00635 [Anaerolineae bacterium]|nr:MAG: hypothetical protein JSV36_00635 [Anaerolineae bacterium]
MKRSILIAGSAAIVVLLLASAAFVGGRLLGDQNQVTGEGSGPRVIRGGPGGTQSLEIVPAEELPSAPADVRGLYVRREDNSLLVGTGEFMLNIRDGEVISDYDGPEVEVVVTHDTVVYRDKTQYGTDEAKDGEIQQVVRSGSLEEIEKHSLISVWGQERGSRLFAEVLVYKIPLD